jgi:hypothetical protein
MKEINEQWIKDEAEKYSNEFGSYRYHPFKDGANSILPFYNSLKAENERLREILSDVDFGLASMEDYSHGEEGTKITQLRGRVLQYLETPDKQSPQ